MVRYPAHRNGGNAIGKEDGTELVCWCPVGSKKSAGYQDAWQIAFVVGRRRGFQTATGACRVDKLEQAASVFAGSAHR